MSSMIQSHINRKVAAKKKKTKHFPNNVYVVVRKLQIWCPIFIFMQTFFTIMSSFIYLCKHFSLFS